MALYSLFPTVAPKKTSGDIVDLANMVLYLVHQCRTLAAMDCIDFMCRKRWNTYQDTNRMKIVGNYLEVLQAGCTSTTYQPLTPSTVHSNCTFSLFPFFFFTYRHSHLNSYCFLSVGKNVGSVNSVTTLQTKTVSEPFGHR